MDVEKLGDVGLFAGLTDEQRAVLADLAEERTCAGGEVLFRAADAARYVFVLMEGNVRIQVPLSSRPESIGVATITQPGQVVGWSGLGGPGHYTASAVCGAETRLIAFDGAALMDALEADCELGFIMMRRINEVIAGRVRNIQAVVLKTL